MHTSGWNAADTHVFQSAPARESGRCATAACDAWTTLGFNPRPLVRAGDAATDRQADAASGGFNPRPLVRAGDASETIESAITGEVSIRARS